MTEKNLIRTIRNCMNNMSAWHLDPKYPGAEIVIEISKTPTAALGSTIFMSNDGKTINQVVLKFHKATMTQSNKIIEDTVYHELAHVVAGPNANHGPEWKKIVQVVNEKTGLHIKEVANTEEITNDYWDCFKYVFRCKGCGTHIGFMRKTYFVKHYNEVGQDNKRRFTCSSCGSDWERIK